MTSGEMDLSLRGVIVLDPKTGLLVAVCMFIQGKSVASVENNQCLYEKLRALFGETWNDCEEEFHKLSDGNGFSFKSSTISPMDDDDGKNWHTLQYLTTPELPRFLGTF
jgi:hypothetical protein